MFLFDGYLGKTENSYLMQASFIKLLFIKDGNSAAHFPKRASVEIKVEVKRR